MLKAFNYPLYRGTRSPTFTNIVFVTIFFDVAHYLECTSAISMVNDNSDDINLIKGDEKERGPVLRLNKRNDVDRRRIFRIIVRMQAT